MFFVPPEVIPTMVKYIPLTGVELHPPSRGERLYQHGYYPLVN